MSKKKSKSAMTVNRVPIESPKEPIEDPIEVLAKQQNISYDTAKAVIETRKALEEAKIRSNEMAKKYEEISNALALQLDTEHKKAKKALEEANMRSEECSKALELLRRKSNPIFKIASLYTPLKTDHSPK